MKAGFMVMHRDEMQDAILTAAKMGRALQNVSDLAPQDAAAAFRKTMERKDA